MRTYTFMILIVGFLVGVACTEAHADRPASAFGLLAGAAIVGFFATRKRTILIRETPPDPHP